MTDGSTGHHHDVPAREVTEVVNNVSWRVAVASYQNYNGRGLLTTLHVHGGNPSTPTSG